MNAKEEQILAIVNALHRYGARLTDDARIAKGDKVLSVRVEILRGRLRFVGLPSGNLIASFSASKIGSGVAEFVERFWYWSPS